MKIDKTIVLKILKWVVQMLLLSIVILYLVESIVYDSYALSSVFMWGTNIGVVAVNLGIVFLVLVLMDILTQKISVSFLITALLGVIVSIIYAIKMDVRGEALTLSDVLVVNEALQVAGAYKISLSDIMYKNIILVILIFICLELLFGKRKNRMNVKKRVLGSVGMLICFLVYWNGVGVLVNVAGGGYYLFVTEAYYTTNGLLAGLARTTPRSIQKPEEYSKNAVQDVMKLSKVEENKNTPNIIFVMNESLYDMSLLDNVEFNKDPLGELKQLQEEYTSGSFLSPAMGGGTCNVEFEVLTSCSLDDVGGGLPYTDKIKKSMASLVTQMKKHGYYTTSFHPNTGSYFNRRNVYNFMGFDELNFTEEMGELPLEGNYASDLVLYQNLIKSYEQATTDKKQPYFSYVITMQNHGGYEYEYKEHGIELLNKATISNEKALETYANLEYSSIEAFKYLIHYFEQVETPTVIVMFGDHAPGLSNFGYQLSSDKMSIINSRTTPLLVWNNYDLETEDWGYINGYNLGAKVLQYCNISMDESYTYSLQEDNLSTMENWCYYNEKWIDVEEAPQNYNVVKNNLWLMNYDKVFGKNYGNW